MGGGGNGGIERWITKREEKGERKEVIEEEQGWREEEGGFEGEKGSI